MRYRTFPEPGRGTPREYVNEIHLYPVECINGGNVEHRYGQRLAIRLDVLVHRYGRLLGKFRLRNISIFGIFLETGELYLPLNTSVDLTLILSKETDEIHEVKGMIVRQSADGIGIVLAKDYRHIFSRFKQEILNARTDEYPRLSEEALEADKDHGRRYRPAISRKQA